MNTEIFHNSKVMKGHMRATLKQKGAFEFTRIKISTSTTIILIILLLLLYYYSA